MGSNKSNTNSSMGAAWKVVQNGSNSSAFGNDEDDSSGMAWVKKRRAEREQAKLEAERKEQADSAADVETPQPPIPEEQEQETPRLPTEDNVPQSPVDTPTMAPAEQPHEGPEHITTAVNLPPQRLPSQRLHRRESSFSHRTQIPQTESSTKDKPQSGTDLFDMELEEKPTAAPETPEASVGSTSEDDDEDQDSSSGGEDDEDESDVDFEVCIPHFLTYVSPDDPEHFRRRMRIGRRPWALVSRKLADIRTYLRRRRPPICLIPL